MRNVALQRRLEVAKRRAHGQWPRLLDSLGVPAAVISKRNQPCPACGGKDRFQFTDKYGDGNYVCRGCGPGDGLALLELCRGWTFIEALQALEERVGATVDVPPTPPTGLSPQGMRKLAETIWQQAQPVSAGDAVATYLARRGLVLAAYPGVLRTHPALGYYAKEAGQVRAKRLRSYPAMVAAVQSCDGELVSLHRTYLEYGAKAPLADCKKLLMAGVGGAAVRLFEPSDELAIAEGIETALAVHMSTAKPVWAALSAGNLEKLAIPAGVRKIGIYADHDANYAGQAAAYALARRIRMQARTGDPPEVEVHIPRAVDSDWADMLLECQPQAA